jgi:hypothetical protein
LGLLRTGIVDEPLHVLDQCRTTPAMVLSVGDATAEVIAQPLVWDGTALCLGTAEPRTVRWQDDGLSFVDRPQPGDRVSLHWDAVCDLLTPGAFAALHAVTARSLRAVNATAAAAPVLA